MIRKEQFHPLSMADKAWIEEIYKTEYLEICDQTFGMNYAEKYTYNIQVARICDCVVFRYEKGDFRSFSYPVGKNAKEAALEILDYMKNGDEDLIISPIPFSGREELLSLNVDNLMVEPDMDYFDYVYLARDLEFLRGSKYSAKRNHINRFTDSADWSHEPLCPENAEACLALLELWRKNKENAEEFTEKKPKKTLEAAREVIGKNAEESAGGKTKETIEKAEDAIGEKAEEYLEEELEIKRSLEHLEELGFFGSVIRKEGEIIAFSICERQNKDTIIVHYEKAKADIQGAFQMINRETVAHADVPGLTYVNREDDLGIPGLRKAKQSYYPYFMGRKYGAYFSDVIFANERDLPQLKALWKQAFGDEDQYIDFYFDTMMQENAKHQKWLKESELIIKKNGQVAAMGSFLEGEIEGDIKVRYVYGLATREEYKYQGLCKRMIQFARDYYDCPLVLKPGSDDLREMYLKMGFEELKAYPGTSPDTSSADESGEGLVAKHDGIPRFILTDDLFQKSSGEIVDECDYTEGLMILRN